MKKHFTITDENAIDDIKLLIKSKKYEMIVNSIDYFFRYILNKDLNLPEKMRNLSNQPLTYLKSALEELSKKDYYDYKSNSSYYRIFTSIYKKKEAIDFLLCKIKESPKPEDFKNLNDKLQEKLDPTNRSITIKDISDMIYCLKHVNKLLNKDIPDIIKYLKDLNEEDIKKFESFSKKFVSIIALDKKSEGDSFKEVYDIINEATFLFHLDSEDLKYKINGEDKKISNINELTKFKNKINMQSQNKIEEKKETKDKDIFETKCDKLKFFKDLVSETEIIYDKINILRSKGYNLQIEIKIEIKYPKVTYELYGKPKDFNYIKEYLFNITNEYENQLSEIFESDKYIRFLYGKLLRKVSQHQKGHCKISEIIRYILNKTKVNKGKKIIKDTDEKHSPYIGEDYEKDYPEYMTTIFKSISEYLIDLFTVNELDFQKHYENMIIKEGNKKGISIIKCKEEKSMEENILSLFAKKLYKLPIAQNILICSRETTIEEMQSFLYRAILCEFNTLFVLEILDTFSTFQQNKMYSYIDKLTTIKMEKYKQKNKDNKSKFLDKSNTSDYLDSYIVFIYKKLSNESAFKNELNNYMIDKEDEEEEPPNYNDEENKMGDLDISDISFRIIRSIKNDDIDDIDDIVNNITVISSDVCGLGKSFRIKNIIERDGKICYHFPLGGKLTKNIIYQKILDLFEKIKVKTNVENDDNSEDNDDKKEINEEYTEFNNAAIHLDIVETNEIDLINEFLFSFLITKFYTNNENIIYIPSNIKIYIEVPNSTKDYLTKFGILNAFNRENIILGDESQKITSNTSNVKNVPMLPLKLEPKIKEKFKRIDSKIGEDKEIEKFIRGNFEKIGIKNYSYNQIQTFIKLYISQFDSFEGELKFYNSKNEDITPQCIEHFAESTKYFIDSGFANKLMNKDNMKDIFDLCECAYNSNNSDISKEKFNTPLIYIDKKNKTCEFEMLPDIAKEKDKLISNKDVDIVYLIDATGSMGMEIIATKDNVIKIFEKLTESNKEYNFRFGSVFYRDKIDSPRDKDEYFQFTDNMKDLQEKIAKVKPKGGGDLPEDWVGGYEIALNDMKWRENGIKLIIHIADAGAHGTRFTERDKKHDEEAKKLPPKIEECVRRNINIIGFKISDEPKRSFDEISKIYNNFKKDNYKYENGQFIEIYEFFRDEKNQEVVSNNFNKLVMKAAKNVINPSYKYLKRLKKILDLDNDVEKEKGDKKSLLSLLNDNYVITEDNYKKMVLLYYRIKANEPVIIMGETGCGKTSLIKKLSQILNNGDDKFVEIIQIHPGITDEEITKNMEKMNETAKSDKYKKKELWIFFDEINTCLSLSLLTEIFRNRTFKGKKIEDNIRLMGACNPYRKRKEDAEICGLIREDDEDDQSKKLDEDDQSKKLVYLVEQLPESLLYYVFSFGSISKEDEKKYIESIIQKLFVKEEEKLHDLTTKAISKCHQFLRQFFDDPSIVSLREIARFTSCVEFFQEYFPIRNNKNRIRLDDETKKLYKIKSIICSIYICYYIRLTNETKRKDFETKLLETLLDIVNYGDKNKDKKRVKSGNLLDDIKYEKLRKELVDLNGKSFEKFSDLLEIEEEFLFTQVNPDKGIGKNQSLKENLFLIFIGVVTEIPLIIVGKPGTGKSLSAQLVYNSMRGEYSKNSFFKNYPKIVQKYFQGSKNTNPEDVEELFKKSEELYEVYGGDKSSDVIKDSNNKKVPICMILFDELGLAEQSKTNPLKVLHNKLEYDGKKKGTCFIGISNYSLDAAKVNRALSLSVPNLEDKLDQLKQTADSIVKSIFSDGINNNNFLFNILARAYYDYKHWLNFIKELTVLKQYLEDHKKKGTKDSKEIKRDEQTSSKQHSEDDKNIEKKDFKEIKRDEKFIKLLKEDRKIKTEFHGNRDFYSLIKGVAIEVSQLINKLDEDVIVPIINHIIERNFGGITYDIDIDFNFVLDDLKKDLGILKDKILNEKLEKKPDGNNEDDGDDKEKENNKIKVTSVFLFKKIYNEACSLEKQETYQIQKDNLVKYDLNECINNNINDNNSRYLLLEIRSNLAPLINKIIRYQNSERKNNIDTLIGSPFSDFNNSDYKAQKINEIQNFASQKYKLIILQNLDQILAYLYDLFNMNYKLIDDQRFVRICLDNFSEQLTPVSESFKIIVLVDKKFVNKIDMAFLNRLEKMQISFQDLLDRDKEKNKNNNLKKLIETINGEIKLKETIKKKKKRNLILIMI